MNASELKEVIRIAFRNVKLDGGVSLRQAKVMDNYGEGANNKEFKTLPEQEITNNWEAIPDEIISQHCYLSHLDAKGFRYYIPAFMLSSLREPEFSDTLGSTIFALYPKKDDLWDYKMMHYSLLDAQQRSAVAQFLSSLPQLVDLSPEEQRMIERAIRNFWHEYLRQD